MELTVYLASRNRHKCHEIESLGHTFASSGSKQATLTILPGTVLYPAMAWEETGQTYLENARIKASSLRQGTPKRIIADDSGLEVKALNGAPGVFSSSFGGIEGDHERNVRALLKKMEGVPLQDRQAFFTCLILYYDLKGCEWLFEGRLMGSIAEEPAGSGGFGYDPIFIPEGYRVSLAELSDQEKNAISHRGRAVTLWKKHLAKEIESE